MGFLKVVRNRILADSPSCSCPRCLPAKDKKDAIIIPTAIFGLLGVILLMLRYWEFCLAVPFLAIAYYCFEGAVGLRFTVHVGNVASIGIVFLILCVLTFLFGKIISQEKVSNSRFAAKTSWAVWILAGGIVIFLLRPNIQHAQTIIRMWFIQQKRLKCSISSMKFHNRMISLLPGGIMVLAVGFTESTYFYFPCSSDF